MLSTLSGAKTISTTVVHLEDMHLEDMTPTLSRAKKILMNG